MALSTFCDGRVFGERRGAPLNVLALHGWARDHRDWVPVLRDLDVGAVALDLPGFGASPPPPEAWGSREYAKALLPVFDDLSKPVVVVGHSFGGRVALQLADLAGGAVGGMVLSGVPLGGGAKRRPKFTFRLLRALHRKGLVGEAMMEKARSRYGSDDYRRAQGILRAVLVRSVGESYDELLDRLTCPVELVWGSEDTAAPIAGARDLAQKLPQARLNEIEGGDHFACLRSPQVTRAAVERLLNSSGS